MSADHITRAVRDGHATRVHPGVYVLGPARLTADERLWAAYLAGGDGAHVSHQSARALLAIRPWTGPPHITSPRRHRPLPGAFVHTGRIAADHSTPRRGMRVTSPPRTLVDCALTSDHDVLVTDIECAIAKQITTFALLEDAMASLHGHRGLARYGRAIAAIADDPGKGHSRTEMELLFARLARDLRGLPPYLRNHRIHLPDGTTLVPDAYFPRARTWVELDSRTWHERRRAMDDDRRRDQRIMALGFLPFRIVWVHLVREWGPVSRDLLDTLALRSAT